MNAAPSPSAQSDVSRQDVLHRLVAARLTPTRPTEVLPSNVLVGAHISLRPLHENDRETMIGALDRAAGDVAQYLHVHQRLASGALEPSSACFDRLLSLTRDGDATGLHWRRAITLPNQHVIGMVHILAIDRALECKGDAGWWLDPRFRGAGLAAQAVSLATKFALRPQTGPGTGGLGLLRVVAAITPDNVASQRVALKAGYMQDPTASCGIAVHGVWKTHQLWHADAAE